MDNTKQAKGGGRYQGQDADFGVFRPMADQQAHLQDGFASWTQFSGIPQPADETANFRWDQILTPPNTPATGVDFDVNNSNYFNHFNLMNSLGKNSPSDFDADPRGADSAMLASTPVGKSLLEALSSPNSMIPPPDSTLAPGDVFNFHDPSQDGYNLYAEALEKLGSSSGSYNLFGTSDVLPSSTSSSTPTKELDGNLSNKPSYSEVARLLKNSQGSSKDSDSDIAKKKDNTMKSMKAKKKFVSRPLKGHNSNIIDDMTPVVSPDSKYGLDDFGEVTFSKTDKDDKSHGLDIIPPIVRKNSTSSLSSGTSGIEEIHLPKSCYNYENTPESKLNTEKLPSNKDKGKTFEHVENTKEQKPFFDPKKMFQSKDTNKRRGQSQNKSSTNEDYGPTLLNNGKPSFAGWGPTTAPKKSTHYINNNLRDSLKKTNQDPSVDHNVKSSSQENLRSQSNSRSEKTGRGRQSSKTVDASSNTKPNMPLQTTFDQELIDEWLGFLYDKAKLCLNQLWTLVLMVILLIFSIIVYLLSGCVHILSWIWKTVWNFLERKVFKGKFFTGRRWVKKVPEVPKKIGLDENIALPATGDEAMQRLLACKGKDPYSILGLKTTATDEDIKKYYRKQAVLVHPDKNQQPGAEEAFKILGHAFDLIGDSTKRQAYDRQLQEATEAEAAMREFNDLLTKLQEKIQQASNMMRCDNCGGKHRWIPVDRPIYWSKPFPHSKILDHFSLKVATGNKMMIEEGRIFVQYGPENIEREFNDLLTKLQEKIQQASNMMRCDNCGGKHRRIPVDRPWYAARFCDRCSIRHSAKEGDVWAETSMLGFLWHYYACMEGKVFDITEWVSCKREFFKHLQANAHHVFYRIATEGNRGGHHHRSNGSSGAGSAAGTEGDLEDFISHLFHQAMNQEGSGTSQNWQQPTHSNNQPWF